MGNSRSNSGKVFESLFRTRLISIPMILNIIIGLICALLLLIVMLHIFALAHIAQRKEVKGRLTLPDLRQEPNGVEKVITCEDGTQLRALHRGSGHPVILIHDVGTSMVTMNQLYNLLAGYGFRVIAYDMRGHGSSTIGTDGMGYEQLTGDLKSVMDAFQLSDAILVGHSAGASLALRLSLTYGAEIRPRIKGIVSLSGFDDHSFVGMLKESLTYTLLKLGFISRLMKTRFYSSIFASFHFGDFPDPASIKAFTEIYNARPLNRLLPLMSEKPILQTRFESQLKELNVPCACIWSEPDGLHSKSRISKWKEFLPDLQLAQIRNGSGHMMVWECPGILVDMIRKMDKGIVISAG